MFSEKPENFIKNSSIGIHAVDAEGTIVYANQYELETLGYEREEYVGRHVSEFQLDPDVLSDMLSRMGKFEVLKNYPARVKGKSSTKYIIYNSSVYEEDGAFVHTRCYGSEVEESIYKVYLDNIENRK